MRPSRHSLSIHRLFAIFVALAVLLAPSVPSAVMAASHHNLQMMEAGHCDAPASSSGHHDKMNGKSCCISICTGAAVAPNSPELDYAVPPALAVFVVAPFHLSCLGEIATPPPRRA